MDNKRSKVQKRTDMPMVGVGVFVRKDDRYLFAMRLGSHGAGKYQVPGGHVEYFESLEDCAKNEVLEETGLTITNVQKLCFFEDMFQKEKLHYITIYLTADYVLGEVNGKVPNPEPEKHSEWKWYDLNCLPEPVWVSTRDAVKILLSKK